MPDLHPNLTVYRALLYNHWVAVNENGKQEVTDAAFVRRSVDIDGLSVFRSDRCKPGSVPAKFRYPIFGLGLSVVRQIKAVECNGHYLGVICTQVQEMNPKECHSSIIGVPFKEDLATAERIASLLAELFTYVPC